MGMKLVRLCVLVVSVQFVCGQYSTTPCPGVFDFVNDGHHVYGQITLRPVAPVSSLVIRLNFTVAAKLLNNYVGRIDAQDSNTLLQRYNRGQPATYLVHFPVTNPLPKLTSLTVNGETVCYGPGDMLLPDVASYVTTLSLQHTSFLQGGGGGGAPVYNNFQHQPQIRPSVRPQQPVPTTVDHIHFGDDDATAHIYTFNNVEPTWNTGNTQYYVVNNTNPYPPATQQYQPPTPQYQRPTQQQPITQSRPTYEYDEPPYEITSRRPARPPAYPVTNRPTPEPAPVTRPNDYYFPAEQPAARPESNSNFPEEENVECGTVSGGNNRLPLIYNGNAYDRGEMPWLVAIYKTEQASLRFVCGGTLVSERHIISAAHCMQRRGSLTSIKDIVVKVGVHHLNDWSDDITVTRALEAATIHEAYNPLTLQNDILVLTLDKSVRFNQYIRPACLWAGNTDLSLIVGRSGTVAGWGDQGVGGIGAQGEPHKVNIPIVSTNDCRASKSLFHELTFDNTLCAGDRKGSGPCVGDSGGGMYLFDDGKWRIRGVVSVSLRADNGDATCNLNEYVVFTDTAKFLQWIRNIMAQR
ncbi:hypothetical protein PYW07_008355 [Mythimna separata]|uniref:Peptidase S1 domain-containing protein n=1 Tax=Mythimna separata TaxID=271217 RepID=A0AAD7YCX2_MYTSE|nr:hypothetical protein PYW07_008355 [Mythimna separata]